jgi:hypothetical protein
MVAPIRADGFGSIFPPRHKIYLTTVNPNVKVLDVESVAGVYP